ncbi:uncharacterized protein ARB_03511 [Trichophyton benhamiae CBS 112371]|uniref:t-SNARE coiled-coil homology domain-containing protein n=1 Tax=Arthroderma benhamiae (strain ATCC MYA-4681 / CBS 112371) TaxID=663331 RepID=D4B4X1_ARTBC|nr:uncharacterized protein ARB_03511 [Trichophyton benhamiae CBS 112371]EFE29616.1 hypothetical protein ARB_03511 [Trichophyton benhamiae CBS 112371]
MAAPAPIQDRTTEFRSILSQAQKRLASSKASGRQSLQANSTARTTSADVPAAGGRPARSEFARRAAEIGRGIASTTGKLQRLAQLAKRKSLFDDRPVEISELTYVIKQDLSSLNSQIASLQSLTLAQHPKSSRSKTDHEGEHNDNVVVLLQGRLADVGANFKDVLEVRTKNIQASRSRTENFVSTISSRSHALDPQRSDSPLYNSGSNSNLNNAKSGGGLSRSRSPQPGYRPGSADVLTLDPSSSNGTAASSGLGPMHSDQQLLMMEEAQPSNTYIHARGEAIEAIERTINELGGIFGQLATMVSEQSEMIQRIDANTEDVVDNVQGAQRELMKYWSRVSGNRWLIAKMFGVLMMMLTATDILPSLGPYLWVTELALVPSCILPSSHRLNHVFCIFAHFSSTSSSLFSPFLVPFWPVKRLIYVLVSEHVSTSSLSITGLSLALPLLTQPPLSPHPDKKCSSNVSPSFFSLAATSSSTFE